MKRANCYSPAQAQSGMSLVELMVALVAGLIVVGAVLTFTVSTVRANTETIKATRLTQELRTISGLISREVRRAGAIGEPLSQMSAGISDLAYVGSVKVPQSDCLIFGYRDSLAASADSDWKGFRLDDGDLQIKTKGAPTDSTCTAGTWESLTGGHSPVTLTAVTFKDEGGEIKVLGDKLVKIRVISLAMTAHLKSDATVSRSVTEIMRIRSDTVADAPSPTPTPTP